MFSVCMFLSFEIETHRHSCNDCAILIFVRFVNWLIMRVNSFYY